MKTLLLPWRALTATIAGAVCTAQALWTLLHPQQLAAVNRAGWLYERFGAAGVGVGGLLIGLAMLVGGSVALWRWWSRWRQR